MSNDFSSIIAYSGENNKVLDFKADPYYYHSSANNNFSFFCDYNAPSGEVDFVFPDSPCGAFAYFEAYSGEVNTVDELIVADWTPWAYTGEELDLTLLTFRILPFNEASTGEHSTASMVLSRILEPVGYSGEVGTVDTLTLPPRASLSIDGYSGEYSDAYLASTYVLDIPVYTGEEAISSLLTSDYGTYILLEGPAAYWKFNEQSGSSVADSTGNNSPATNNGASEANSSPVASQYSFHFNGTSNTVVGNPTGVVSANLTQELWVKPDAGATITLYTASSSGTQGTSGQRYAIWPKQNGTGSGGGISIGSNGIQVVAYGNGYMPVLLSYQQAISTTQYTHVLVSWNDRTPTLYVNGTAVATGYQARSPFASQGLPSDGSYGYYKGYMQDVAIYTSALTAAQAREHYLAGLGLHYLPHFEPVPSYAGEVLTPDLTIDTTPIGYLLNYAGEYTQVFVENNVQFSFDMLGGEVSFIYDELIVIAPNTTITNFHGLGTHSQTSTCLSLNSNQSSSSNAGVNAYFALPFQLSNDKDITFYFKRTKPANWYDDFTDAGLWFCYFPNYLPSNITFANWSWGYDMPVYSSFKGAIVIRMRFTNSNALQVNYIDASSGVERTNTLTVNSSWTTNETNGTDECSIVIHASSSNTIIQARGKDAVVRQTGTFANMTNPFANGRSETTDTFLIHYHNYMVNAYETLCDMRIEGLNGFILVEFASLGTAQAYSDETAFIDNLRTVSLLDAPAFSGELNEVVFSTAPAVDLGIIANLTGETTAVALLTSSIIQIPFISGEVSDFGVSFFQSSGIGVLNAYGDETADIELLTYAIFRDIDAREGQSAASDLTTYPPALLVPSGYGGENALFNLSVELAIQITGYSGEAALLVLDAHPSINLGTVFNYAGQSEEKVNLVTASVLPLVATADENALLVLYTRPSLELAIPAYSGEYGLLALATASLLDAKGYAGEYGSSTLTIALGTTLVPFFYPGTWATAALRTTDRLVPIAYSGETSTPSLTNYPAIPIYPIGYSGETASASILPGITFPSTASDGGYGSFDLEYVINTGMPAEWHDGESVDLTLSTTYALPLLGQSGEAALLYFGTSFALYPQAYDGNSASAALTLNPFDQLDSTGYSGQVITPALSTTTRLPSIGFSGELTLFDLHQSLPPNVIAIGYSGELAVASFQIAFQLPIGRSYTGTTGVVDQMATEPNIHFYGDEVLTPKLSTTDVFVPTAMGTGNNFIISLKVGKSEGIGSFPVYSGSAFEPSFNTIHHADLYVLFRTSIWTQVDIGSATYFDLNTDACCGVRKETLSSNLNIQLFVHDYFPEAISDGDRVVFSADLSAHPRFSVGFTSGQVMDFIDRTAYLGLNFVNESSMIFDGFDPDLSNRLCKGYFIPNGNWVVVEMNDILPEDCYADFFYSGTTMSCVLSDDITLRLNQNHWGESMIANLTISPPWLFIFITGEILRFDLALEVAMYPRAYAGEVIPLKFYDPPFLAYTGESGELELEIEYHVRFKEVGCLDNNFTFQNDSGDAIPELQNPVPVEGEPYYHSVLGECF